MQKVLLPHPLPNHSATAELIAAGSTCLFFFLTLCIQFLKQKLLSFSEEEFYLPAGLLQSLTLKESDNAPHLVSRYKGKLRSYHSYFSTYLLHHSGFQFYRVFCLLVSLLQNLMLIQADKKSVTPGHSTGFCVYRRIRTRLSLLLLQYFNNYTTLAFYAQISYVKPDDN